jgi:hypothetical protein
MFHMRAAVLMPCDALIINVNYAAAVQVAHTTVWPTLQPFHGVFAAACLGTSNIPRLVRSSVPSTLTSSNTSPCLFALPR